MAHKTTTPPAPSPLEVQLAELGRFGRVLGGDRALFPAWGQERLLDQLVQHVGRAPHKSFVLSGGSGTGKSHLLANLATRLRAADPSWLVLETSTSEVMTDTKYIGEWETKLKNVVALCLGQKRVVLYFTDINSVITQGATVQREATFEIGVDDVVSGLAATTGLPERLLSDRKPLATAEVRSFFEERVLGQDEAVGEMVDLITLIKAGLTDPKKPYAVVFFVGPTGVGKTEIAKTLAEFIFGSPERMIRVDMSEYTGADALEKLIGSPWRPDPGTTLPARVRAQPFSVVLLDEIEKAMPQVFDLCLQMFDDGRLTDARGHTADFRRTIIVLTSNLASRIAEGSMGFGGGGEGGASEEAVLREVKRFFRPEFVNRLDKVVVFKPLSAETMRIIVRRELGRVLLRSGIVRRRLLIDVDPAVVDLLCREGFSSAFGARPLKRRVADLVLVPLGREIVKLGEGDRGSLLRVGVDDGRIAVRRMAARAHKVEERLRLARPKDERTRAIKTADLPELLRELDGRVARLEAIADRAGAAARKSEIVAATAEPTFWDDGARARERLGELVHLEALL